MTGSSGNFFGNPATAPVRLLAAGVDYLVVSGLFIAASKLIPERLFPDGAAPFLIGLLYFGLAHTRAMKGQTIGKALFGLRVGPVDDADGPGGLPLGRSILRYLLNFGALIILAELPPAIYRANEVFAPSWQLELHMLPAFAWLFANGIQLFLDPERRTFADLLTGALVVRGENVRIARPERAPIQLGRSVSLLAGSVLAAALWWFGLGRPEPVERILQTRYVLENRLNVRVYNAQLVPEEILVEALAVTPDTLRAREGRQRFLDLALATLRSTNAVDEGSLKIRFRLYGNPAEEPLTTTGEPLDLILEPSHTEQHP